MRNWRWNPYHPEHMVPGSFWKLKNETALYYLDYFDDCFELDKIYFLAEIEEKNGVYNLILLDDTKAINTRVVKGCWDNIFELVQGSNNPKPERQMFLGRIPMEELNVKLKQKG